jgi:hypothetical protein
MSATDPTGIVPASSGASSTVLAATPAMSVKSDDLQAKHEQQLQWTFANQLKVSLHVSATGY